MGMLCFLGSRVGFRHECISGKRVTEGASGICVGSSRLVNTKRIPKLDAHPHRFESSRMSASSGDISQTPSKPQEQHLYVVRILRTIPSNVTIGFDSETKSWLESLESSSSVLVAGDLTERELPIGLIALVRASSPSEAVKTVVSDGRIGELEAYDRASADVWAWRAVFKPSTPLKQKKCVVLLCIDRNESLDLRMKTRPAHLEWLQQPGVTRDGFIGPLLDPENGTPMGSMLLITASSPEDALSWSSSDPYAREGLFESVSATDVRNVTVTRGAEL